MNHETADEDLVRDPRATLGLPSLIALHSRQIAAIVQTVPGGAENVQDIYPLSPLQEGMLFHYLLNEQSDTYILSTLFELESRTQINALIGSLESVIRRHDVLRTAILWEKLPKPVQVVYRHAPLPVEQVALDQGRDVLEQFRERMRPGSQSLNLQRAPLMRLQTAGDRHSSRWFALLQLHHAICDYRSWKTAIAEVMTCLRGCEHELPAVVPYRNYVARAAAHLGAREAEAFFRSRLQSLAEPTAPFGLLDTHGDGSRLEEVCQALDPVLAREIRVQSRRLGTSPARLFHAAWALVVAGTSGQNEVVYGTVLLAAEDRDARAERMLGLSVNTLPLRIRLRDVTAEELLEQTHRELAELLKHAHASLTLARRCSGIDGTAPLFTALLNFRHRPAGAEPAAECGIRVLAHGEAWTNYPLALTVDELEDRFLLTAQTHRDVGARRLVDFIGTAMRSLVDALDQAPGTAALSLSILPERERHRVVASFNATEEPYPLDRPVHLLFEEQAAIMPQAVAVVHGEQSLTYAELNRKANQLARYLRKRGVRADQRVGICMDRGLTTLVALLGVLKSGAAYVPLDPSYPPERLQCMIEDAAPFAVLTQEKLTELLPSTRAEVIVLDQKMVELAAYDSSNVSTADIGLTAGNLVYVIFTSGSTGRPKGVAMPHRAMANLIEWHRQHLPLRRGERVLQFAALSFDVAFQETFSTLCDGGTLVFLDEWVRRDPRALVDLLARERVERFFAPPIVVQSLTEFWKGSGADVTLLQDVIVAGEQLRISEEMVFFFGQHNGCRLHNHYGPTETHVVTTLSLPGCPTKWPGLPTIGRPISNTQVYVLDARRQPVPIGTIGEIYIGGANVACGYLGRPELTAERFVADPFQAHPQARLYKTGDLGRWRADGTIEYLGRGDDQVKVRGFRVELAEIEAQLARHAQVKEVAVLAREDTPGQKRIVAYVTSRDGNFPGVEVLADHLKARLPEYMIPSAVVAMDRLPLTPSGKVNRRALPAPAIAAYAVQQYEPPRGEAEQVLALSWQELLGVEQVGRDDHFFKLGGNSMTVLRLLVKVADALAVNLAAMTVFQYPTLRDLAQIIEILMADAQEPRSPDSMEFEEGIL